MRDVARVFVARQRECEHENMDLKRTLLTLSEQLKVERQRADAAEHKTREVLSLFKSANEAKAVAEQDAARANEGLRLYKLQYENAQEEIRRAQKLIDSLEAQRFDAEEAAAKARSTARQLKEEKIITRAREEGRRQGIEEGMAHGRVLGYEEGRVAGFESGRAATERAFTSEPVTEMDYEESKQREYQTPRASKPSTPEDSLRDGTPEYTRSVDNNPPFPPIVANPTPIRTPPANPTPPKVQEDQQIHPVLVHNGIMSPSHPPVDVPPDGWIPSLDGDQRIRLPPPHEMAPPPPTSPSPTLSAVLSNVKNIEEPPAIMIPPPAHPQPDPQGRRTKSRRRNSTESLSTTMSQFDMLHHPSAAPSPHIPRHSGRDRSNTLSAIAEERERQSSASSSVYGTPDVSVLVASLGRVLTCASPSVPLLLLKVIECLHPPLECRCPCRRHNLQHHNVIHPIRLQRHSVIPPMRPQRRSGIHLTRLRLGTRHLSQPRHNSTHLAHHLRTRVIPIPPCTGTEALIIYLGQATTPIGQPLLATPPPKRAIAPAARIGLLVTQGLNRLTSGSVIEPMGRPAILALKKRFAMTGLARTARLATLLRRNPFVTRGTGHMGDTAEEVNEAKRLGRAPQASPQDIPPRSLSRGWYPTSMHRRTHHIRHLSHLRLRSSHRHLPCVRGQSHGWRRRQRRTGGACLQTRSNSPLNHR